MTNIQIEIISDESSERLHQRVDDFIKNVNVLRIKYESILGGSYAYIYYKDKEKLEKGDKE